MRKKMKIEYCIYPYLNMCALFWKLMLKNPAQAEGRYVAHFGTASQMVLRFLSSSQTTFYTNNVPGKY
jgi:hypothetical protein